jgi:hypothetical protein
MGGMSLCALQELIRGVNRTPCRRDVYFPSAESRRGLTAPCGRKPET